MPESDPERSGSRTPFQAHWNVLVPVKAPMRAKTRLVADLGEYSRDLAVAFAYDTVDAVTRCDAVESVTVVTGDESLAELLWGESVALVPEGPVAELNHAVRWALRMLPTGEPVAVLLADLPALRVAELRLALERAARYDAAFLADARGDGTTLLTARRPADLRPRFGRGSAAAHAAAGMHAIAGHGLETVRCDVDNLADLKAAVELGLRECSREVLRNFERLNEASVARLMAGTS